MLKLFILLVIFDEFKETEKPVPKNSVPTISGETVRVSIDSTNPLIPVTELQRQDHNFDIENRDLSASNILPGDKSDRKCRKKGIIFKLYVLF